MVSSDANHRERHSARRAPPRFEMVSYEHHPDQFLILRNHLIQAQEVINKTGGINGHKVTLDEEKINVMTKTVCVPMILMLPCILVNFSCD